MKSISNKRVLVTGGTEGLGKELVVQLTQKGAKVATFSRSADRVRALLDEYPSNYVFQADISRKEDIHRISGETFAALGRIDILINNASTLGVTPLKLLLDTECETFEAVLEANLLGPFRLATAVLPSMITQNGGLIINISSDAAVNGYPRWGAYAASKAGLDQLSRVFNAELSEFGIHTVAVDPGDMKTTLHFAAIPDANPDSLKDPALAAKQLIEFIERGDFSKERIKL
jgi:NAD(P)-dependent dehydrogenase (short-subunit alcohol dehydrogenase family)